MANICMVACIFNGDVVARGHTPCVWMCLHTFAAYERVREQTRLQELGQGERQRRRLQGGAGSKEGGEDVVLEGAVDKRGQFNPQYQTRFFSLHRCGLIRYYKPGDVFADRGGRHLKHGWRRCAKPQGTILLRGASVDPVDENAM